MRHSSAPALILPQIVCHGCALFLVCAILQTLLHLCYIVRVCAEFKMFEYLNTTIIYVIFEYLNTTIIIYVIFGRHMPHGHCAQWIVS